MSQTTSTRISGGSGPWPLGLGECPHLRASCRAVHGVGERLGSAKGQGWKMPLLLARMLGLSDPCPTTQSLPQGPFTVSPHPRPAPSHFRCVTGSGVCANPPASSDSSCRPMEVMRTGTGSPEHAEHQPGSVRHRSNNSAFHACAVGFVKVYSFCFINSY